MPVYQIKNISENIKVGVWKITETEEDLIKTLTCIGFDKSTIYQTKNKQRLNKNTTRYNKQNISKVNKTQHMQTQL